MAQIARVHANRASNRRWCQTPARMSAPSAAPAWCAVS